jgi:hypothetical protein
MASMWPLHYLNEYLNKHQVDPVPRACILTDLLIEERKSVLFVGEGNFSFTVAFAALREHRRASGYIPGFSNPGTWDGIIATRYEAVANKPPPNFPDVIALCIQDIEVHNSNNSFIRTRVLQELDNTANLLWECGIDATAIPLELMDNSSVIWFQCPWIPGQSIYPLIHTFLIRASETIAAGVHVCVGITAHKDYVERYELHKILGSGDCTNAYFFCGADDILIQNILGFGYRHQGLKDIHEYIRHAHVTLVFCKR